MLSPADSSFPGAQVTSLVIAAVRDTAGAQTIAAAQKIAAFTGSARYSLFARPVKIRSISMQLLVQRRRDFPLDYVALCSNSWRKRGYYRDIELFWFYQFFTDITHKSLINLKLDKNPRYAKLFLLSHLLGGVGGLFF